MKKYFTILGCLLIIMTFSCKRGVIDEPLPIPGPAGSYYIVEGSADPSVLYIRENYRDTSRISVRASDYLGNPVVGQEIFLEMRPWYDLYSPIGNDWLGFFEGNDISIRLRTNGNGEVTTTYYGPDKLSLQSFQQVVYIKATLEIQDQSDLTSVPYDYIQILLIRAQN